MPRLRLPLLIPAAADERAAMEPLSLSADGRMDRVIHTAHCPKERKELGHLLIKTGVIEHLTLNVKHRSHLCFTLSVYVLWIYMLGVYEVCICEYISI